MSLTSAINSRPLSQITFCGHRYLLSQYCFTKLAILSALDTDIEVVAVVCDKTNRKTVAKTQVISHIDMLSEQTIDLTYLVVDIYRAQPVYENLVEKYGAENVRAPKSLYVAPYSTTQCKLHKKSVQ